jgi:hypothetical protein
VALIPVISSNVASYAYLEDEQTMIVQFLDSSVYEYYSVPKEIWQIAQTYPSKGQFVWKFLRDQYEYSKVK